MWNAEGKMRNEKCGTTAIGPQVILLAAGITTIMCASWRECVQSTELPVQRVGTTSVFLTIGMNERAYLIRSPY